MQPDAAQVAEPFRVLRSRTVVLPQANIDTDQIIPARFLATTRRHGLGRWAFNDWRRDADDVENAGHILNRINPATHRILVAGENFGCGSSREHAPWALMDFGFQAIVSSAIADIFKANALNNGLLPIEVAPDVHAVLVASPNAEIEIDLERCVLLHGGRMVSFAIEPFARECLLAGTDGLGWLLGFAAEVAAFEQRHEALVA